MRQVSDPKNLGLKMQELLFEPGNPRIKVNLEIDEEADAANAL